MTGYVEICRERGRTIFGVRRLCGLSVMGITLHLPEQIRPGALERKLSRAAQILRRASVHRIIFPRGFPYREYFREFDSVELLYFYRSAADVLVLGWLEHHGIDAKQGRVTLAGTRLSPDLEYAALRLCSAVREICIDVPGEEGVLFAAELQRSCGVPVTPKGMSADLTVEFSPLGRGQLRLWGEEPLPDGLRLIADGVEPPAEIAESVLALLWEQGKICRNRLRVIRDEKYAGN